MLNAILDKLQAPASRLIVGSFLPLVIFAAVNCGILYLVSGTFRLIANAVIAAPALSSGGLMGALMIVAATFTFSALQPWLRATLEGANWPEWLARFFRGLQWERYSRMRDELHEAVIRRDALANVIDRWRKDLKTARATGAVSAACTLAVDRWAELAELRQQTAAGYSVDLNNIDAVRQRLVADLNSNNAEQAAPASRALAKAYDSFYDWLDRLTDQIELDVTRRYTRLEGSFASDQIAPTTIGNIAATIVSYSYGRYRFNVEMLLTRLQKAIQADVTFNPIVQESKTQLDFAVGTLWALMVSCAVWPFLLPFLTDSVWFYASVVVALPVACALTHAVAIVIYRSFADVMRTCVDLYRFNLIDALHLHRPSSVSAERRLWEDVNQNMAYGAPIDLPYEHRL